MDLPQFMATLVDYDVWPVDLRRLSYSQTNPNDDNTRVTLALSYVSKAILSFMTRLAIPKLRTVSSSCHGSIASLFPSAEPARWSRA